MRLLTTVSLPPAQHCCQTLTGSHKFLVNQFLHSETTLSVVGLISQAKFADNLTSFFFVFLVSITRSEASGQTIWTIKVPIG